MSRATLLIAVAIVAFGGGSWLVIDGQRDAGLGGLLVSLVASVVAYAHLSDR